MLEPTSSPVTSPSVSFSPVNRLLYLGLTGAWGRVDLRAPAVSHCGCIDRVHLAVAPEWKFDFLYLFFTYFVANLKKIISRAQIIQIG